ncbi:MAG: hypothetical protein U5K31_13100 [Balneolaceae bacterium]|nr:hypothetical protein [Balneolaceae bacterium]
MNWISKSIFLSTVLLCLWCLPNSGVELTRIGGISLSKELAGSEILFSVDKSKLDIAIYSITSSKIARISHNNYKEQITHIKVGQLRPTDLLFNQTGDIISLSPETDREFIWQDNGVVKILLNDSGTTSYRRVIMGDFVVNLHGKCFAQNSCMKLTYGSNEVYFARFPNELSNVGFIRNSPIAADQSSIYLGQNNFGLISRYNLSGMLIYAIPTIRSIEHKPTQEVRHNTRISLFGRIARTTITSRYNDATNSILDIDVNDKYIITLFSGSKKLAGRYIDVYNKNNGEPIGSIALNKITKRNVIALEVVGDSIFLLSQDAQLSNYVDEFRLVFT